MRIACDARPLLGQRTGVGVWLEGLLRVLEVESSYRFVLALPRPRAPLGLELPADRFHRLAPPVPLPGTLWLTTVAGPSLAGRADVYLATLGILPRRLALPSVLVVHDLTPRTRPHQHTLANRFCFNAYFAESVAAATVVVCDSEATRQRLATVLPRQARAALVIPPGLDGFFTPPPPAALPQPVRDRFAAGRPFVVQLGTVEPRKGVATLLEAHARLLATHPQAPDLVLAGALGWGRQLLERALARHPRRDRVHVAGYVTREEARELLRHAELVVVAAEEEGFGLPLAEAMACGAVCLASNEPALVEVAGGAAEHFQRGDAAALAAAVARLLAASDRPLRRERAVARACELSWDRVAAAWRQLLASLRMPADAAPGH
jgi:glycosyltransferase involved in cell wall biosynthesis